MTPSADTLMLGRGVKRKWSCLEELEGAGLPAEKEQQQQRRHDEAELAAAAAEASHLQQRQLVLGLCLEKLQRYQVGVELSLRRSVLLVNTLRQIQEDMRSEGAGPQALRPDSRLLRDDFREDVSVTCPGCAEGEGAAAAAAAPPPPPSPGFSPQGSDGSAAAASAFSDAVSAMGYLGDLALDDIFEDIDTSMYESSDLWPAGVSLWADEDAKPRPPSPGTLQSCLMDLNELDHIMEILVKS